MWLNVSLCEVAQHERKERSVINSLLFRKSTLAFSALYINMSVVVVAGGLGDMGRLITEAIYETGKYEVYVMSRSVSPSRLDDAT